VWKSTSWPNLILINGWHKLSQSSNESFSPRVITASPNCTLHTNPIPATLTLPFHMQHSCNPHMFHALASIPWFGRPFEHPRDVGQSQRFKNVAATFQPLPKPYIFYFMTYALKSKKWFIAKPWNKMCPPILKWSIFYLNYVTFLKINLSKCASEINSWISLLTMY